MLAHGRPMRCCYSRNVGLGDLNSSRICTTPRDTILSYGRALRLLFGDVQDKLRAVRKTLADFDLATKLIGSGKSWQAGEKALHPGAQVPLKGREIPHASLQTPRPHRTYVWPAQRLATRLNPRRPMPQGLPVVIPPFLAGCGRRTHAAIFSFMAGVIPPMPMFGRSLL